MPWSTAWICSSTSNQLSDCVKAVSEFAQTFMEWGWLDGCADLGKLENVEGYTNPSAGDGVLTLWEIANYSQALTKGFAWQKGDETKGVNRHFQQKVVAVNEKLLKNTVVATGVKLKNSTTAPDRLGLWTLFWEGWGTELLDVRCWYFPDSSNCVINVSDKSPWLFYDIEYIYRKNARRTF